MSDFPLHRRTRPDKTKVWIRYDHEWPSVDADLDAEAAKISIELEAFKIGLSEEDGGLGVYQHFRNICESFWPSFEWHRWSEWQARKICETRMTGFTGAASTAKSTIMVLYGLANYIADPRNTMCMVLTTSIKDAETRIWKEFTERFNEVRQRGLTGFRISNHEHIIRLDDTAAAKGNSIQLVAAGDRDRDNALQKLQGAKSKTGKVIILWDEAQDCSESVYRAVTNLANNPRLEVKCTGNASHKLDAHGQFCTPKGGWGTITENDKEWPIEVEGIPGVCLHLDGYDSPNFDDRTDITWNADGSPNFDNYDPSIPDRYPYIKRTDRVKAELEGKGTKDPDFWRQCRGFWPPSDIDVNTIYPQGDLYQYGAMEMNVSWLVPPIQVLGVDPAKGGGDRFMVHHLKFGACQIDQKERDYPVIYDHEIYDLKIEGSTDEQSYHTTMVLKVKDLSEKLNIPPFNVAVDASALDAIGSLFHTLWSPQILLVDFAGKPSEKPVAPDEKHDNGTPKKCNEVFDRKVSEIWGIGRKFLLKKQIAGLRLPTAKELSGRKCDTIGGKMVIEPKEKYKERHKGQSPDCFVAGTLISTKDGFRPIEQIKEGDLIRTPFGYSPVAKVHCTTTLELAEVSFSNGATLIGKPSHKIFTWEKGWVRMGDLELTTSVESVTSGWRWNILNQLFTTAENTGFKVLVNTIKTDGTAHRRDFFTGLSGVSTMDLFLKSMQSIIKITTGPIMTFPIWSWFLYQITQNTTPTFCGAIPTSAGKWKPVFERQLQKQPSVFDLRKNAHTAQPSGEKQWLLSRLLNSRDNALTAKSFTRAAHFRRVIAVLNAEMQQTGNAIAGFLRVLCAEAKKMFAPTTKGLRVQGVVHRACEKETEVYNLTLFEDNVYYANGVLVQNCAEAFLIGVHLLRERFGAVPGGSRVQRNPWMDVFNNGQNRIDNRKPIEIQTLKTAPQFRPQNQPLGSRKGELYRWLSSTQRK